MNTVEAPGFQPFRVPFSMTETPIAGILLLFIRGVFIDLLSFSRIPNQFSAAKRQ